MWYPEIEMGCQRGISAEQNTIVSRTNRIDGCGGNTNSFCAWNSLRMSFWSVPPNRARSTPAFSATATYIASNTAAGELIVIDVVTFARSTPAYRSSMSASVSTATPHLPTSPSLSGSSESRPMSVGRSKAVDRPPPPDARMSWKRRFVSSAVPNPANMRIVHNFDRYMDAYGPRVYGYWPGNSPSSGPYTGSTGRPDIVSNEASRVRVLSKSCSQFRRLVMVRG